MGGPGADIAASLGGFLDGEVQDLVRLSGGASRDTFAFSLTRANAAPEELILQRVRSGATGGFSMEDEGALLRAAGAAGVPVAPLVAASNDAAVVGAPFIVVRKLDGETIARRILR